MTPDSLYAEYVREREGSEVLEQDYGFIEYQVALPFLRIESLYIRPEFRKRGAGTQLADRIALIGQEAGCTHLWAQVWLGARNANDSLRAILAYGFQVQEAHDNCIILIKEIKRG